MYNVTISFTDMHKETFEGYKEAEVNYTNDKNVIVLILNKENFWPRLVYLNPTLIRSIEVMPTKPKDG